MIIFKNTLFIATYIFIMFFAQESFASQLKEAIN